jgi:hypothetical protein
MPDCVVHSAAVAGSALSSGTPSASASFSSCQPTAVLPTSTAGLPFTALRIRLQCCTQVQQSTATVVVVVANTSASATRSVYMHA